MVSKLDSTLHLQQQALTLCANRQQVLAGNIAIGSDSRFWGAEINGRWNFVRTPVWEADALFLTALLTVVGFSVQDTIVVFDRIRENIPKRRSEGFELVVNRSLLETLHRSLATQLNAIFVLIALLLLGGATTRQFVAVLLVGLLSGTYSSLFNAVPLLVVWETRKVIGQPRRAVA